MSMAASPSHLPQDLPQVNLELPPASGEPAPLCVLCMAASAAPGRQRCEGCLLCQKCHLKSTAQRQRFCEECAAQGGGEASNVCVMCKAAAPAPGRRRCQNCLYCQTCRQRPAATGQNLCSECLTNPNAAGAAAQSQKSGGGLSGFLKNPFGMFGKQGKGKAEAPAASEREVREKTPPRGMEAAQPGAPEVLSLMDQSSSSVGVGGSLVGPVLGGFEAFEAQQQLPLASLPPLPPQ